MKCPRQISPYRIDTGTDTILSTHLFVPLVFILVSFISKWQHYKLKLASVTVALLLIRLPPLHGFCSSSRRFVIRLISSRLCLWKGGKNWTRHVESEERWRWQRTPQRRACAIAGTGSFGRSLVNLLFNKNIEVWQAY